MFLKVLLVVSCLAYATADLVNSVTCANDTTYATDIEMEVTGCSKEHEKCLLIKGHSHSVVFRFTPTRDFVGYTQFKVFGVFTDFAVPYGRSTNACTNTTVVDSTETCTTLGGFKEGTRYQHQSSFGVSKTYPSVKLRVRFAFVDRKTKTKMLCQEIPVELIDPTTTPAP